MITLSDVEILRALTRYHVLSRPQIQRLCRQSDRSGRATRRRLQMLVDQRLINRQHLLYSAPDGGAPAAVYFPAVLGCEFLSDYFGDERYRAVSTLPPIPHHIPHWLAISETHIAFDAAIAGQGEVRIDGWINEFEVVNKDESIPEKRYRLYTLLSASPRLVCAPDAAFLLTAGVHKKVFYVEQDRNTTGARAIADQKTKGYAALADLCLHLRHFPDATIESFTVIMVTTHPKRRDALRDAIRAKPGAALWRFAAVQDMDPETLLHAPIFHPCDGEPSALIRR